jgi:hypothetical protein
MSKRYSILAAALVASGRSHLTVVVGSSGLRPLELRSNDDLSIEERSRLAFVDREDSPTLREPAMPARRPVYALAM